MEYTESYFERMVQHYGEVFFVLDSDREYEVHGNRQYDFLEGPDGESMVHIEGMQDDEYIMADFPLDAIEHHYAHDEV